jgi:hypothetical protein
MQLDLLSGCLRMWLSIERISDGGCWQILTGRLPVFLRKAKNWPWMTYIILPMPTPPMSLRLADASLRHEKRANKPVPNPTKCAASSMIHVATPVGRPKISSSALRLPPRTRPVTGIIQARRESALHQKTSSRCLVQRSEQLATALPLRPSRSPPPRMLLQTKPVEGPLPVCGRCPACY